MNKKILFLTGTRADFGKLKSLIEKLDSTTGMDAYLFVTGMHMLSKYGMTANEIIKCGYKNIYQYINQSSNDSMDVILAKTVQGLSDYVKEMSPDLIVIHGDRVEAMAGAIVGSLNNILVAHIEGGEVSGTIDELIRHATSKMSHIHFVCNDKAKSRLIQLGELSDSINVIGSPDLDVMFGSNLPTLKDVMARYEIDFRQYALFMYHPVTTSLDNLSDNIKQVVDALIESNNNYIVIFPNNDHGTKVILKELERLRNNEKFKVFPSIRFECFLTLLKNSEYMIGNSSAGVREAPFYGVPTINIGNRQNNRATADSIFNCLEDKNAILKTINDVTRRRFTPTFEFGEGKSSDLFVAALLKEEFWQIDHQKVFVDLK